MKDGNDSPKTPIETTDLIHLSEIEARDGERKTQAASALLRLVLLEDKADRDRAYEDLMNVSEVVPEVAENSRQISEDSDPAAALRLIIIDKLSREKLPLPRAAGYLRCSESLLTEAIGRGTIAYTFDEKGVPFFDLGALDGFRSQLPDG